MDTKRPSGPYPLSCITCRERRKKCDRTHPTCKRCKTSGFTCRGYASRDTGPADDAPEPTPQCQTILSFGPDTTLRSGRNDVSDPTPLPEINIPLLPRFLLSSRRTGDSVPRIQPALTLPPPLPTSPWLINSSSIDGLGNSALYENWALPNGPSHVHSVDSLSNDPALESNSSPPNRSTWPEHRTDDSSRKQSGQMQPDLSVYISPDTSPIAAEYITSQYERAYSLMSHELANPQESFVKSCVLVAITVSKSACWSLFLGAKVYEAALSDHRARFTKKYIKPLDIFGQDIARLWELRFLIDPRLAYRTLQLGVPIFLSIVDLEYTAWNQQTGSLGLSLHRLLVSRQVGLGRFAATDVTMSFLTGLPQFISWDTSFLPELAHMPWEEWIPACPAIFVLVLSRVNAWRHQDPFTRDPEEWLRCEKEIKEWRPSYHRSLDPSQSWRAIGRIGVQEALRHMVFIYLYMGMCDAKSGDPRVQESCKQIAQMCRLVDANPNMSTHLYFPALFAGVCAINEKHRSAIYSCLQEAETCRSFLFGTAGFTAAIEHLWHGVGRDGAQVTWDDYVDSCRAVVKMKH